MRCYCEGDAGDGEGHRHRAPVHEAVGAGLRPGRHRARAPEGVGRGPRAGPGVRGGRHQPARRRSPGDLRRAPDLPRGGRGADVSPALSPHREDRGPPQGTGEAGQAVLAQGEGVGPAVSSLSIPTVILGVSALLVASRIIVKRTSQIPAAIRSSIIETLDACIFAAVLSLVIITFVVQAFYSPSGSMEPTLMVNDRILVAKFLYRFEPVRRGDVIVFRYPLNPQRDFVKRVIGLPHDRVQLREGVVYVNGHRLDERDYTIKPDFGNYGPVTVPPGQYFVLGDNRNNSEDSRFFGFVPRANIIGKAVFIYWPPQRVGFVH